LGYAALRKISKVLGLPGLHLKTYQRDGKRVTGDNGNRVLLVKLKQSVEFLMSEIAQSVGLLPPSNILGHYCNNICVVWMEYVFIRFIRIAICKISNVRNSPIRGTFTTFLHTVFLQDW